MGETKDSQAPAARGRDTLGVVAPPPLIYLAGLGAGLALDPLLPEATLADGVRWALGLPLIVGGLLLMGSFVRAFRDAGTAVNPGRPSTAIVTEGPYRFTRNPGYLGMALLGAGIAILADAVWALAFVAAAAVVIDRGVVAREERYLSAKFGSEYAAYRSRVRRWI